MPGTAGTGIEVEKGETIEWVIEDKATMVRRVSVEKNTGEVPKQVVVDGGFISRENIVAMSEKGVDLIGPMGEVQSRSIAQLERRGVEAEFYPDKLIYDELKIFATSNANC